MQVFKHEQEAATPIASAAAHRLADDILSSRQNVVCMSALAGSGKTAILEEISRRTSAEIADGDALPTEPSTHTLLIDFPAGLEHWSGLDAVIAWSREGPNRLAVIAKRPITEIPGLERAVLSEQVRLLTEAELFVSSGDTPDPTGGWPILASPALAVAEGDTLLARYLEFEILEGLSLEALTLVEALTHDDDGVVYDLQSGDVPDLSRIRGLFVSGERPNHYRLVSPGIRALLHAAARRKLARFKSQENIERRARLLQASGKAEAAILLLINAGIRDQARDLFHAAGGYNFIYYFGEPAFDRVLDGFAGAELSSNQIVMARALRSLRNGHLEGARHFISQHFGPDALSLARVYAERSPFPLEFKVFRAILAIYEPTPVPGDIVERMIITMEQLPESAAILRGNFLNALLEINVRQHRVAEASGMAKRALDAYSRAGTPMLCLYIEIFQAIIGAMRGDITAASERTAHARKLLEVTPFENQRDERLLSLIEAILDYEKGSSSNLSTFLLDHFSEFSDSEFWPSLVTFVIEYGSRALATHVSTFAALDFLDRWRLQSWQAFNPGELLEVGTALILQDANRWMQATRTLLPLSSTITADWLSNATFELGELTRYDDIALTMAWLRSIVHDMPKRPTLPAQIDYLLSNRHVSTRHKMSLTIWKAFICRLNGDLTSARSNILEVCEQAARLSLLAPLREEGEFVQRLLGDHRTNAFLHTSGIARNVLRQLEEIELLRSGATGIDGLTRREARILILISEGSSNKFVAKMLGITEATVKFHLTKIYKKLNCKGRAQAIATARSYGWIK